MPIHDIPYEELKPIYVSPDSKLNEEVIKNFNDMFAFASPLEYRDAVIEVFHMYLIHEYQHLPPDFFDTASRIKVLLDFLKSCEH